MDLVGTYEHYATMGIRMTVRASAKRPEIWIIAGASASGKTECAKKLEEWGFARFEASDYTVPFVEQSLEMEPHCAAREELYEEIGADYVARRVVDAIKQLDDLPSQIAISGIRKWEDLMFLEAEFGDIEVIAVHRDLGAAFEHGLIRVAKGERTDHPASLEEFYRLNAWEQWIGLGRLFYVAKKHVFNSGSMQSLYWQLSQHIFDTPVPPPVTGPGIKLSPDNAQWAKWHLTHNGWQRGAWKSDRHVVNPEPRDTVRTVLYVREEYSGGRRIYELRRPLSSGGQDGILLEREFGICPGL